MQFREISTYIDSGTGTLLSSDGARISRDDYLPKLILADEVIFFARFVIVSEENNVISLAPKKLSSDIAYKIIGDSDYDGNTEIMFSTSYLPEKSDLENGIAAFHIKSNTVRFAEAIGKNKSLKGEFVIVGKSADPVATVVLAKDHFIAENRPYEDFEFEDVPLDEVITGEDLQLLLDLKANINHTHVMADISDFEAAQQIEYAAGSGIEITEDNVINCTVQNSTEYTAGDGINISEDNVISCTVESGTASVTYSAGTGISIADGVISCTITAGDGESVTYTPGDGIAISEDGVISCTVTGGVSEEDFEAAIGDIDSILDSINGEVI